MAFLKARLTDDTTAGPPSYLAQCTGCDDDSGVHHAPEAPELWALQHSGRTGHLDFRGIVQTHWRVSRLEGP
jgi:hypothetical protein